MDGRIETELLDIKRSLEKALTEAENTEQIFDLLCALERTVLTPKLIKETKLGNVVASVRSKLKGNTKITEKAVSLLANWKKIIESSMKSSTGSTTNGKDKDHIKKEHIKPTNATFITTSKSSSGATSVKVDINTIQTKIQNLSASRKSIYNILFTTLSVSSNNDIASSIALNIEEALNTQLSAESNMKAYMNKAKSLAFNLKKNNGLRDHVITGTITAHDLVALSAADLASHEQKLAREKLREEVVEARRTDWLEAHKEELQADIGIDPSNVWSYDLGEDGNNSEPDVEGD